MPGARRAKRGTTPKPNAHKKKETSRAGNPVSKYSDTHKLEGRRSPPGKLEVDGPARVVDYGA